MKKWLLYTFASIVVGSLFGWLLLFSWYLVHVFLGYGDSGPSWINTVNDVVLYGGIITGTIAAEVFFIIYEKRTYGADS